MNLAMFRQNELFADLTEEELKQVASISTEHHYKHGEYVFMEGQTREAVFFIDSGLVKIFKVDEEGNEQIVNILGAGQMFPHVGFFTGSPYPGTAEVLSGAVLFAIRSAKFEELLMTHPHIMRKVMRVMENKILQLQAKIQELALFDSHQRVEALIRHFVEEHGEEMQDGIHVKLPVTHGEMAKMIGMTRESVNRIWNELRRRGVISGNRDEWIISKPWYQNG